MQMLHNITIKDEAIGAGVLNEFILGFETATVTVEQIIRERVQYEVDSYNNRVSERRFTGLVQPTDSEVELNGYHLKKGRRVKAEKQIEAALSAFQTNGFILLIDDTQAENLTDSVALHDNMNIVFLKVVPLVGG